MAQGTNGPWLASLSGDGQVARRGRRGFLIMGGAQALKVLINLIGTLILVRMLAPEAFGLAAMAALVTNFLLLFKDLGLSVATVQQTDLTQTQVSTVFWVNQIAGVAFFVVVAALSPLIAMLFSEPELIPAVSLLAFGFVFGSLGAQHDALMRRAMAFSRVAAIEVGALLAGLIGAIVLIELGAGWWSLIWQRVIQFFLAALGNWVLCNWRPSFKFDWPGVKEHVFLGLHVSAGNLGNYLSRNADNLLIGWWWGPSALGVYAKSYDILVAPGLQVSWPLGQILQPVLARLRDDVDKYRDLVAHAFLAMNLILLPLAATIMVVPDVTIGVLFGEGWDDAIPIAFWLGLALAFQLSGSLLSWVLITQKRGGDLTRATLFNAGVNIVGFLVAVPFGVEAVAMAFALLGLIVRLPFMIFLVGRSGPVTASLLGRSFVVAVCVFAVVMAATFGVDRLLEGMGQVAHLVLVFIFAIVLTCVTCIAVPQTRATIRVLLRQVRPAR